MLFKQLILIFTTSFTFVSCTDLTQYKFFKFEYKLSSCPDKSFTLPISAKYKEYFIELRQMGDRGHSSSRPIPPIYGVHTKTFIFTTPQDGFIAAIDSEKCALVVAQSMRILNSEEMSEADIKREFKKNYEKSSLVNYLKALLESTSFEIQQPPQTSYIGNREKAWEEFGKYIPEPIKK